MPSSAIEPTAHGAGPLPRVFRRYVLFDQIGRGGMADILLARADTSFGGARLCVVKQMLPGLARDPEFERMLVAEAKLAARLTHANVVQVFDLGREGDRLFIAMEYVEGFDLNKLLRALSKSKVGLPAEFALFIVCEVLRALDCAHRTSDEQGRPLGIVHRDVSPSNVLISFEGEVKLCDFGIARAFATTAAAELSEDGDMSEASPRMAGKSAYMSPEHARGERLDARADVFAAGIILWELCAGRRLYRGTEEETLAQARKAAVPNLPDRGLPKGQKLQAVLDRALAASREVRFQSAAEFLTALEDYAIEAKLMVSQLRLGAFLVDNFGAQIIETRRERERAVRDVASEIPPADGKPSPVLDEAGPEGAHAKDVELAQPARVGGPEGLPMRVWSEPGSPLRGHALAVTRGVSAAIKQDELDAGDLSEVELDRSLFGLEQLAAETSQPVPVVGAGLAQSALAALSAPRPTRDWVWYAVALVIVGLGVAGYLWR